MGHVPHHKPDWNVLLTLVVDSLLILIFAILMKITAVKLENRLTIMQDAGKAVALFSHHSHAVVTFYLQFGQTLTGELMRKIYAASGNLFTHSWSWQSFVSSCDVFNCMSSVLHGWIVYCAFGWEMHRMSKSLEIRFRMASFSKLTLFTCRCLRCKRVEKSQAILTSLDGPQEQHLDW